MTGNALPWELLKRVETFLYAEARLLEDNNFDEWLTYFSDDVRYWMPVRQNVDPPINQDSSFESFALFDDDKESLRLRVLRIKTGQAHAEVPLSVTQRYITNVMAIPLGTSRLRVHSNFLVYQERRGQHAVTFYGRREDILGHDVHAFEIQKRTIDLAQTILPTTISIFF
jgi:3-phenylpropionate/cinnamic acid dioxygenase small subunit